MCPWPRSGARPPRFSVTFAGNRVGKLTLTAHASFDYLAKMRGTYAIAVSVDDAASVAADNSDATLCVWERRRPIILVELAALVQPAVSASTGTATESSLRPVPDAADELSRLTQYYYNVVYVAGGEPLPTETAAAVRAQADYGTDSLGIYIISMTNEVSDVLEVQFLQAMAGVRLDPVLDR